MPRQSQPQANSAVDMYSAVPSIAPSEPSRYSSVQTFSAMPSDPSKDGSMRTTNLDSASLAGPSDPLEAPVAESSGLESKLSTKVSL